MFRVLLFYKFVELTDPQTVRDRHQLFCQENDLKGRVFIATEGINGTVAGTEVQIAAYQNFLKAMPCFSDLEFKAESHQRIPFAKMKTKLKPALVNLGLPREADVKPYQRTGKHLSPIEWQKELEAPKKDFILLDVRNNYESLIGHFEGALCPDLENFWQFPEWAKSLAPYKDKKILMYCTGGIRCEKFSSLLLREGFQDVNQLHGGILNYREEVGGSHFLGKCFVFDDRLATTMTPDATPIAQCCHCKEPADEYVNCANMACNVLFICCDRCALKTQGCCQDACQSAPQKRPFDFATFRVPFRTKGNVFPELGRK